MKKKLFKQMKAVISAVLFIAGLLYAPEITAQETEGTWQRTIIIATLDGATMEYLIDKDTKVTIEKPNLVIETEGVVLSYELEKISQVRYGKMFMPTGIGRTKAETPPFKWEDETIFINHLPENTLIEVFTTNGKQVMNQQCSGDAQLSLKQFPTGVYLIKMNQTTYKILKK
ncbi:MAG: T9SS type A sorting domain-containing protein [Bacteroidaceae bacterium]|nr:T9SS type A sorting domain-containing protein [Bacteroidaceae bacterium]